MRYRLDEPIFTSVLPDVQSLRPIAGSLYITGTSVEERSQHTALWETSCPQVTFARLTQADRSTMTLAVDNKLTTLRLRSAAEVGRFLSQQAHRAVYLDITGLPHNIWAPLLRGMRSRAEPCFCVYVEPGDYQFSAKPTEATIFDLSEHIEGIAPLPGFISLAGAVDDEALFVPLLGFEGTRLAYMLEAVQPKTSNICPIVGTPGFRPEYPFYTFLGNRVQLLQTRAWQNVRYAPANCPFSLYHLIAEVSRSVSNRRVKIAPIGTKPHALGAVLYYLDHPNTTEILYDHPVRKARRTSGMSRACVYDLSLLPPIRPDRSVADDVTHLLR